MFETIIDYYYPEDDALRQLLLLHSGLVRDRALAIADMQANRQLPLDRQLIVDGAMLHDLGIRMCHAPSIHCVGTEDYMAHGILGARMLRQYATTHPGFDPEPYARICERHTGSGITADEVERQHLPIPVRDYLPETLEEKLICLADKFYSKSRPTEEHSVERARASFLKFGDDSVARFDALCATFHL